MLDQKPGAEGSSSRGSTKVVTSLENRTNDNSMMQEQEPLVVPPEKSLGKDISENPQTQSKRKLHKKILTASFATRSRHAVGKDEDEEDDPDIQDMLVDKTPMTKRRIIREENNKKYKKKMK